MGVSIVIVNYRSENYLRDCVDSINKHIGNLDHEIIVVNNDGTDITEIFEHKDKVIVLSQKKNLGFSKACNAGAAIASYDYFIFLNPDTIIKSGTLDNILDAFKDLQTGVVSPLLLLPSTEIQPWSYGKEFNFYNLLKNNLIRKLSPNLIMHATETDWVSGAALCISKKVFLQAGGFDENFFMYFEDIDLCKRVKKFGYKIKVIPVVKVEHKGGQSYGDNTKQKIDYYTSQNYYFKKHFGIFQTFMVILLRKIALRLRK